MAFAVHHCYCQQKSFIFSQGLTCIVEYIPHSTMQGESPGQYGGPPGTGLGM